jgi:hypothetical protein
LIDHFKTARVKRRLSGSRSIEPIYGALNLVFQPHVVLITKKEYIAILGKSRGRKKASGGPKIRADNDLASNSTGLGPLLNQNKRVIGRAIISHYDAIGSHRLAS